MTNQQTPTTPLLKLRPRSKKKSTAVANRRRSFSSLPDISQLAESTSRPKRDESIITLKSCLRHMLPPIRMSNDGAGQHLCPFLHESSDQSTSTPPPPLSSSPLAMTRTLTPTPSTSEVAVHSSSALTPAQDQGGSLVSLTSPPPLPLNRTRRPIVDLDFDAVPNDILLPSVADLDSTTDDFPDAILLPCL